MFVLTNKTFYHRAFTRTKENHAVKIHQMGEGTDGVPLGAGKLQKQFEIL